MMGIRCMNAQLGSEHGNVGIQQVESCGPWTLYRCPMCGAYQDETQRIDGNYVWRNLGTDYRRSA